jgi:hypothetical protein
MEWARVSLAADTGWMFGREMQLGRIYAKGDIALDMDSIDSMPIARERLL